MNADKGVERRLERYVLDELSTGERKRLEELLTGNDAEAAAARDALRFEQCLLKSCEVSSFDGDLAATVLERVFRRNAVRSRGPADEGQARRLIEEAMREGRVRSGVPRERQVPWIRVAAAAAFIGFTALCWWTVGREIRREPHPNAPGQGRTEVAKTTPKAPDLTAPHPLDLVTRPDLRPVAHVAYAPPGQELSEEDSMLPLTLVASAGGGSALFAGSEIETDESESAVLRLEQGGLLVLRPATRLRLIGTGQGSVQIQLEQGAVVFQLPPKGRPLDLMTLDGRRSRLHGGSGEVSLGSSMTDRAAAGMLPLRQILMVRPRRAGFATLVSGTEAVRVTSGQVGLASSETALAFDDQVGPVSGMVRREWRIDELVPQASALALSVGNREFTRAEIAKDLLRVYGEDLVELVTRSVVVQWELQRLGIPITPADRQDAEAHVANDEMMQVAPLRSTVARDERVSIMAGLLALCRHRSQAANGDVALTVAQQANQTWAAIERQLELDPALDDPRVAFRIRYQGMTVQVTKVDAWKTLRRFIQPSEIDLAMNNLIRRELVTRWLRARGGTWSELSLSSSMAELLMARLSGMTRVQLRESMTIELLTAGQGMDVTAAEIDDFLASTPALRRSVVFDHFFAPVGSGPNGPTYAEAMQAAEATVRRWRSAAPGRPKSSNQTGQGLPWRTGTASGPRPWWPALYGPDFSRAVMSLPIGVVSDPIPGPDGLHVVCVRQEQQAEASRSNLRRSWASAVLRSEKARLQMNDLVDSWSRRFVAPQDLLE